MTALELMKMLEGRAREYREDGVHSLIRNRHLVKCVELPDDDQVDAVLVDFINFVGRFQGIDYALSTKDWPERR